MVWFRIDDSFYDHPKVFDAPDCAVALWTRAGSWSARNLTDGFVPAGLPARLCDDPDTAVRELLRRGLWSRKQGGFQFHDWTTYQLTADEVKDLRTKRAEAGRLGGLAKARATKQTGKQTASNGVANASTVAKQNAAPTRPDPKGRVVEVDLIGGTSVTRARDSPPEDHCETHRNTADPPPCGGCADARRRRETWDRDRAAQAATALQTLARQRAEATRLAIAACRLCDHEGYAGPVLCTHDPRAADRAHRGAAAASAAIRTPDPEGRP